MSRILFENKKVALGFAGAIVIGTAAFAAVSGMPGPSGAPDEPPREEIVENDRKSQNRSDKGDMADEQISFADDEALIDDTGGFDTEPSNDDSSEDEGASEDEARDRDRKQRNTGAKDDEGPGFERERRSNDRDRDNDEGYSDDDFDFGYDEDEFRY